MPDKASVAKAYSSLLEYALATESDPLSTCFHAAEVEARQQLPIIIFYEVCTNTTGVCITCTFLDSSITDCVAVIHQRISQLSSSGLMHIESSHKFSRSDDTAYGCIEGVDLEQYQIGVVRGVRVKQPTQTSTS